MKNFLALVLSVSFVASVALAEEKAKPTSEEAGDENFNCGSVSLAMTPNEVSKKLDSMVNKYCKDAGNPSITATGSNIFFCCQAK